MFLFDASPIGILVTLGDSLNKERTVGNNAQWLDGAYVYSKALSLRRTNICTMGCSKYTVTTSIVTLWPYQTHFGHCTSLARFILTPRFLQDCDLCRTSTDSTVPRSWIISYKKWWSVFTRSSTRRAVITWGKTLAALTLFIFEGLN
jgi:hypothetical protein